MEIKKSNQYMEDTYIERSIPDWCNNIEQITDLLLKIKYIKNSNGLSKIVDQLENLGYGEYDSNYLAELKKNVKELEELELRKEKEVNELTNLIINL